jgi:N6-adenosine-specific RNA methylase IME4
MIRILQGDGKYDVILADPPWRFKVWATDTGGGRSPEKHYPTLTIDDICKLPVGDLAADNCVLFLWCVWPSIFEFPQRVMAAWGFEFKTNAFTWVKAKRSGFGHHFGMGYYTRANTEPCLLAVRGDMPIAAKDVLALIYSPVREHSRKPDEQYGKIERLYPNMRYLELFARKKRDGWDAWGNEIESDIHLPPDNGESHPRFNATHIRTV